jgi:cell division protein FtsB
MSVIWQKRTHGILRRKQHADRILARVYVVAVVLLTTLAAGYLTLVASNVHTSRQIWAMEQEVMEIQRETHALQVEIARLSSIPILQERSVQLGYRPAESVDYVYVGEP